MSVDKYKVANHFAIDAFYLCYDKILAGDYNVESGSHDFWEIVYVDDGKTETIEDENVYIMEDRNIIFHAPMEYHCLRSYGNTTPRVIHICFDVVGDYPKEILSGVYILDEIGRKEFLEISKNLRQWLEDKGQDKFYGQEIADRLASFMFRLCRTHQSQQKKVSTERVLAYKRLAEMMKEEVSRNMSIAEIAEKLFMSVSYVKVLFKRYAGVSPKTYYTNLQINEATKMLAEGKSVREVAERMNFSTPSYFSVFFKKHTGLTPKQYRNRLK